MSSIARYAVLLCVVLLTASPAAAQDDVLTRARSLATNAQRPAAITELRAHLQANPTDSDAQVLLGTILSWEGQYADARAELDAVLRRSPNYGDAVAALINVELWSDHPAAAKALADSGLAVSPNDDRFLSGRRRAIELLGLVRPWETSLSYNYDWFNDDRSAWSEIQGTVKRATSIGSVIVRGARAERFGLTDGQFEVEIYPRIRKGTYAYASVAIAPDHELYPKYRYATDLYQSIGGGVEVSGGFRRLGFTTPTHIYLVTMNKYVGNWLLTGKVFYIPDRTGASSKSFHGSFRRYFGAEGTSYLGARYSRGMAREEVRSVNDFEVLSSDTVAIELNATVLTRLVVQLSGSSSRQERVSRGALHQHSLSATAGWRF